MRRTSRWRSRSLPGSTAFHHLVAVDGDSGYVRSRRSSLMEAEAVVWLSQCELRWTIALVGMEGIHSESAKVQLGVTQNKNAGNLEALRCRA